MNILVATKQTLRRPVFSAVFTVGLALLAWRIAIADRPVEKSPIAVRKMHIESIPMCELLCIRKYHQGAESTDTKRTSRGRNG